MTPQDLENLTKTQLVERVMTLETDLVVARERAKAGRELADWLQLNSEAGETRITGAEYHEALARYNKAINKEI